MFLFESIKLLFKNKYWVMMLFAQLFINMTYILSGSTGVYYTKYILGNENLVGIMGAVGLIPVILGFAAVECNDKKIRSCQNSKNWNCLRDLC